MSCISFCGVCVWIGGGGGSGEGAGVQDRKLFAMYS